MPKGKRLMIVDDDATLRRTLARMLRNHWDCVVVSGVLEAVAKMREAHIDVILSDWDMPDGGGARLIELAKAGGIPIIILSGGYNIRCSARMIAKPATLEDIDRALWEAIQAG